MGQADIREQITSFRSEFDALPDVTEPPRTTLDVLREHTREKYWNRLLHYFLTPDAPHGFGTTLLERFLEIIEAETDSAGLTDADPRQVHVESEVMSDQGRPDLLLYIPDEWFACIELKVTAPETREQTAEYAASRRLGNLDVTNYTREDRVFIYLAKEDHASPASDRFAHVCWTTVEAMLGEVLTDDRGQYPARSTAQLADFRDRSGM